VVRISDRCFFKSASVPGGVCNVEPGVIFPVDEEPPLVIKGFKAVVPFVSVDDGLFVLIVTWTWMSIVPFPTPTRESRLPLKEIPLEPDST